MKNETTQEEKKERKLTYSLQTFESFERMKKSNHRYSKKTNKERIEERKRRIEQLKKEIEENKQEIQDFKERNKTPFTKPTQEEYNERIKEDREYAISKDWLPLEPTHKDNIYTPENLKKEKLKKIKERKEFLKKLMEK